MAEPIVTWSDLYELREALSREAHDVYKEAVAPIMARYHESMAPAVEIMNKYMMYQEPDFMRDWDFTANEARKRFDRIVQEAHMAVQETNPHFQKWVDTGRIIDADFKRAESKLGKQYRKRVTPRNWPNNPFSRRPSADDFDTTVL